MSDLGWGLTMTVAGMGLVFGLLALLWGLLTLVLRFDREPPEAPPAEAAAAAPAAGAAAPAPEEGIAPELVAAITVATLAHVAAERRVAAPRMRSYWPGSQLFASRWVAIGRGRQNTTWRGGER